MALQIYDENDMVALGEAYENGADITGFLLEHPFLVRDLRDSISDRFRDYQPYKVEWVTGQPFENALEMAEYAERTGRLPITTDYNESPLLGEVVNLQWRYVHDTDHIWEIVKGNGCDFTLNGEACAASKAISRMPYELLRRVVYSEVVLQAARFYRYNEFGAQRTVVEGEAINTGYNKLMSAYNIGPVDNEPREHSAAIFDLVAQQPTLF